MLTKLNSVELLRSQCPAAGCYLLEIRWNCIIFFTASEQLQKGGRPCIVTNDERRVFIKSASELNNDLWGERWDVLDAALPGF